MIWEAPVGDSISDITWRFYVDSGRCWHWQQLSSVGTVMDESECLLSSYEECIADAQRRGYVFHAALSGSRPMKSKRPSHR